MKHPDFDAHSVVRALGGWERGLTLFLGSRPTTAGLPLSIWSCRQARQRVVQVLVPVLGDLPHHTWMQRDPRARWTSHPLRSLEAFGSAPDRGEACG